MKCPIMWHIMEGQGPVADNTENKMTADAKHKPKYANLIETYREDLMLIKVLLQSTESRILILYTEC